MLKTLFPVAALVLVLGTTANAATVTISFEELRVDDALIHFVGPIYAVHGFIFTAAVPPGVGNVPGLNTVGARSSTFMGSTPLYNLNGFGGTTVTRSDGGPFDLLSIDLAETPNFDPFGNPVNMGSFAVTFFGVRANGSVVVATATIDPFPALTRFTFANFTNLVAVYWYQGGGGSQGLTHQFDNLRLQVEKPAPPR